MANVGGRQLTLGACGLTKFAETAGGRKVQLHIPKYVQGPVGRACRYADRGCPFRSQRGTALSSHERSCKKQPPPVVPALGAPPPAAPAIAAPPIMMNNNAEEDVVMESVEEEKKEEPCFSSYICAVGGLLCQGVLVSRGMADCSFPNQHRVLFVIFTKHNKIINPVLQNGTFLQNPGLEPSDLAIP